MARFPTYERQVGVSGGARMPYMDSGALTGPARALAGLGGAVGDLGDQFAQIAAKSKNDQTNAQLSKDTSQMQIDMSQQDIEAQQSATGRAENFTADADKRFEDYRKKVLANNPDPDYQQRFNAWADDYRAKYITNAATFQAGSAVAQRTGDLATALSNYEQLVYSDPSQYENVKKQSEAALNAAKSWLTPEQETNLRAKHEHDLNLARAKGKADADPAGFLEDAGVTRAGSPKSAADVIRRFEGFRTSTYWDVNAHRTGYGSDTITKADGSVVRVQQGMTVSRADAERDLQRRIDKEFVPGIISSVGKDAWATMPEGAKAALTSVAYNYGSLPNRVAQAVTTGNVENVAQAIESLKGHNGGVNSKRRQQEADLVRGKDIGGHSTGPDVAGRSEYAGLSVDEVRSLTNKAETSVNAESRYLIDTAATNAPAAIMNTGAYTGQMPTPDDFFRAYGEQGGAKYREFSSAIDTSQQAYQMQFMSADEIKGAVEAARPTSSGDNAAVETGAYQSIVKAAEQVLKAREADPSAYVSSNFPKVASAWGAARQSGDYRDAITATTAAQRQLGIENIKPYPGDIVSDAVAKFQDKELSEQERADAVSGLLLATSDPEQRHAIFTQMVAAGLPDMTEGAFAAIERGDQAAGRRLMQAALFDPSKMPGKAPETPDSINQQIQTDIMDEGQIGDIYYGLSGGQVENFERAQRDGKLLKNAVEIRLRNGEALNAAVAGASKDLFGDVKAVTGDNRINAQIVVSSDANENAILDGLASVAPKVRAALETTLAPQITLETKDGSKAIYDAATQNYISDVMSEGEFRNMGGGYVFVDPFTGGAVAGPDGKPLVFTDDDLKATVVPQSAPDENSDELRAIEERAKSSGQFMWGQQ